MDCTLYQRTFLNIGSAQDITYKRNIEVKLTALCEAAGVTFRG